MKFFPLPLLVLLFALLLLGVLVALVELQIVAYAYQKIGISSRYIFLILFLSLLGSAINIRITDLPGGQFITERYVEFFGRRYLIPEIEHHGRIVLAVNVGGALIPFILASYLIFKHHLYLEALFGITIVATIIHHLAVQVPGLGIAVPLFLPPLAAAITALIISRDHAAPLAYIAGTMGTLIGADILNIPRIHELGAPLVSIGGAGTSDGIFLTGILAILLA